MMKNHKCIIDCLHNHINHNAILTFENKKVTINAHDEYSKIEITEDSDDSRLKKLTIKSPKKFLTAGKFENTAFIELDQKEKNLSCFTHFVKENKGLRQKCDFAFIHKKDNTVHIVISELKSSRKGLNDRCREQFSRSKVFLKYLIELIHEVEKINPNLNFRFYKAVFIPLEKLAIATPETITPTKNNNLSISVENDYTIFSLETDSAGTAEIPIQTMISIIVKKFISFSKKIELEKSTKNKLIHPKNLRSKISERQLPPFPRWV